MSGKSPTQRSLEKLRSEGYLCQIVERWNPHARIRQDLFGIGDILAIREGETLLVQTTSRGNVTARVTKIQESEHLDKILAAGWKITVHGWGKLKAGWVCKIVDF
jgi:hypothetical protein